MANSDERRKVAERLRSEADGYREFMEKWPNSNRPHIDYGEAPGYVEDIAVFIGVVHGERRIYPTEDIFDRLADLIEPEPERTCHVTMRDRYEVRGGQYIEDWDLSCGDHILIDGDMPNVGLRCPVCGARVVNDD